MDTSATYHTCPEEEWFASFEKLDGDLVSFNDSHTYHMEGISTVRIEFSDEMVRELKDVRYLPQLKKNVISFGSLETQSLRGMLGEGILKMFSGPLVVLKSFR